jgi:cell division protein FtsW
MEQMGAVQRAGRRVVLLALGLVGLGIVMVYSSSSVLASAKFADSEFFMERQVLRALLGIGLMVVLTRVRLSAWERGSRWLLLAGVLCLFLALVFGEGRHTQRWLQLSVPGLMWGVAFQPSEFAKLALILYLADVLVRRESQMADFTTGLLPRLAVVGSFLGLIVLQPNLGTAMALAAISGVMLWVGGARPQHLLATGMAAVPLVAVSLLLSPYQWQRIQNFMVAADPRGAGYQVSQSLLAMGSGGVFGVGLGNSMQKEHFLPEPHTDFVFAFIGEEMGLIGTLGVILVFALFAFYGMRIARGASTHYGFLVATGITAMVSIYALLNIGVATKVLPTTGLPLPFISYGGSSLLWNLGAVGILFRVARESAQGPRAWEPAGPAGPNLVRQVR